MPKRLKCGLTDKTSPSLSATNTRQNVRRPKNIESPLEILVAVASSILGQHPLLTKSSNTIAAKEFIPDDTVLKII